MLRIGQSRIAAYVASIAVTISFTMLLPAEGSAKRLRKPVVDMASPVDVDAAKPPARFFTIAAVLAKHDREGGNGRKGGGVQVASLSDPTVASDAAAKPAEPVSDQPFGLFVFRAPNGVLWSKWRTVEARMAGENLLLQVCRSDRAACGPAGRAMLAMLDQARNAEGYERILSVNSLTNAAVRYVSDFEQHGVADLWSSPLETLRTGQGDCEDYAIIKYMMLHELGVAEADLKLLLVRDNAVRQDHAVLGVRVDGRWVVLDNRFTRPLESDQVGRFTPLFALDEDGVSLFAAPYAARITHESEMDLLPAADAGGGSGLPLLL
jgi:predicted transglutaminase-like cysteine proteinase